MRTFIVLLLSIFVAAASTEPVIVAHPAALANGNVLGVNFGSTAGTLWVRPVAKLTKETRAAGIDENNCSHIYAQMDGGNRIAASVKKWGDVAIAFSFTPSERNNLLYEVVNRAGDKGYTLTISDIDFKFQVERLDGARSAWF